MIAVIHYMNDTYLPITATWIYGQIVNIKRYRPIVYALRTEHLDIYPTEKIRSLELKKGFGDLKTIFNKGWDKIFNFYPSFIFPLVKDKPKLVHAHFGPAGYKFLPLKRLFRLPLITTFYGYDMSRLPQQDVRWRARYRKLFQQGDCFLVEGSHMKKSLMELGCPEEKIIVQHLGIDMERIEFIPRRLSKDEEIRVLIAGRFLEKKGIPYAIEAFGEVRKVRKNMRLTIIGDSGGTPREEKEKSKIFRAIDECNLRNCVSMLGYQPHRVFQQELFKHHIFLSPSVHANDGDTEGGAPVSIIEASASGMPILSTTHCDIPEVVIDGESGYLVQERDVNALAKALERLVVYVEDWRKIGLAGRRHIKQNYDLKKQAEKLEEIYSQFF